MPTARRPRRLWDAYRFAGFRPSPTGIGIFGDPQARILTLTRRSKKRPVGPAGGCNANGTTASGAGYGISPVATCASTSRSKVRRVACRGCGKVKQEQLGFLADNPFYTKRFAFYVGRRCRASPIRMWPRRFGSTGTR